MRVPSAMYVIRMMFEWGGGCLWCGNDAATDVFGVGPIEDRLPLSLATLNRLKDMTAWHDQSLNWEYPPDQSPWSDEEYWRFDAAAREMLAVIRAELGPEFEVIYESL